MGVCQNISRTKPTIKAKSKEGTNNDITSDLTSKNSQTSYNLKNQTTRSNLNISSNSTKIHNVSSSNSYKELIIPSGFIDNSSIIYRFFRSRSIAFIPIILGP